MKLLLVTLLLWCATPADEECALLAPNIITANCDGVNCFKITTNCAFEEYTLTVYNRWGEKWQRLKRMI
ncbi:MAG: gliding motility-associated C-terminal domain-containing protein [Sphingobacteriales bacterium JAD_PAG50586_3]|nr:MAG: gliding motility-associated C-terminal domain-containing protein [Sphingobacteriales bacterium JAD_PAG50586_3]